MVGGAVDGFRRFGLSSRAGRGVAFALENVASFGRTICAWVESEDMIKRRRVEKG